MFKIGDKVRATNNSDHIQIGDVGVIIQNHSSYPYIEWDLINTNNYVVGSYSNVWCMSDGELELINEPKYEIY